MRFGAETVCFLIRNASRGFEVPLRISSNRDKSVAFAMKKRMRLFEDAMKARGVFLQHVQQPNWDRLPPPCVLYQVHKNITNMVKNVTAVLTVYFGTGLISQEKNSGCQNGFIGFTTQKQRQCFPGRLVAKPRRVCHFGRVADYNTPTFGFRGDPPRVIPS